MPKPENTKYLIVHITDGEWGTVESIRKFHTDPEPVGRGWADIGYHYVIYGLYQTYPQYVDRRPDLALDGTVHGGRDLDRDGDIDEEIGAHAFGWNSKSLGIALVGKHGQFTSAQIFALLQTLKEKMDEYGIPVENVLGHKETGAPKSCPDLDMEWLRAELRLNRATPIVSTEEGERDVV